MGKAALGQIFSEYFGFPVNHSTECSTFIIIIIIIIIIRGWYNMPNSGRRAKRTPQEIAKEKTK
jgi:hypothetical protein